MAFTDYSIGKSEDPVDRMLESIFSHGHAHDSYSILVYEGFEVCGKTC